MLKYTTPYRLNRNWRRKFNRLFSNRLEPIYGSQERALDKMYSEKDRFSIIPYDDLMYGILCIKKDPQNEYIDYTHEEYIEIKSLFLLQDRFSGQGIASDMLDIASNYSKFMSKPLLLSVNSKKKEALEFFTKKRFEKIFSRERRDSDEHFMILQENNTHREIYDRRIKLRYFREIQNRRKIFEIRLLSQMYKDIQVGDIIIWNYEIPTLVLNTIYSDKFESVLSRIDYRKAVPGARDIEDALKIYRKIYGYGDIRKGVIAIELLNLLPR